MNFRSKFDHQQNQKANITNNYQGIIPDRKLTVKRGVFPYAIHANPVSKREVFRKDQHVSNKNDSFLKPMPKNTFNLFDKKVPNENPQFEKNKPSVSTGFFGSNTQHPVTPINFKKPQNDNVTFSSTTNVTRINKNVLLNKYVTQQYNAVFNAKLLWLVSFVLCLYGATILSLSTWKRYQETPTVISMERNWKEWNTSFPSVTICPTEKYNEFALQDLINTEIRFNLKYVLSNSNIELFNISNLDLTITELGICYAYNSHVAIYNSYSYWTSKTWTILPVDSLMERNPLDGDMFGQIMNMNSGYYGFIHSPMEAPDIAAYMLYSPSYVFKSIELTVLSTYSASKVKDLNIEQRKCRFFNESNLVTSPVYTYRLCRNECRMKLAHKLCGCIPHFYRPSYQYEICDVKGMHCLGQYSVSGITSFITT